MDPGASRDISDRVSRETLDRLTSYHELLLKWQTTINLVASSTLDAAWNRHFVDGIQLWDHAPNPQGHWLDLGSGGGFPGLVVAAIAHEQAPDLRITLVESDIRKCGFLREAARAMGIKVNVLSRRIEDIPPQHADVISARALAGLPRLMELALPHLAPDGALLFPKGESYADELEKIPPEWHTTTDVLPSITDPSAVILRIRRPD
ncbi:16S rRNA (guanine(527)-N(7))-methyltransferase RsmG [Hasllibacter sp. MH4015]|uniref:16S rRNA (guanine(527)-N(7))-methyltransferase RsmG n=1 Tax=Hasllibacter sp. MH4015 TaxID=2854029 RepID=UPI001CD7DF82|nr:16S rRNA (guanine(527)-N(7))-methyltransferase RsmG [Hasllibacter sp. MH4015]